jgi:hypothetical protein
MPIKFTSEEMNLLNEFWLKLEIMKYYPPILPHDWRCK